MIVQSYCERIYNSVLILFRRRLYYFSIKKNLTQSIFFVIHSNELIVFSSIVRVNSFVQLLETRKIKNTSHSIGIIIETINVGNSKSIRYLRYFHIIV